jgi:hypothetical protein
MSMRYLWYNKAVNNRNITRGGHAPFLFDSFFNGYYTCYIRMMDSGEGASGLKNSVDAAEGANAENSQAKVPNSDETPKNAGCKYGFDRRTEEAIFSHGRKRIFQVNKRSADKPNGTRF